MTPLVRRPNVEILESRISPAAVIYFVQNNAVAVFKADGTSAQDSTAESDAATLAHADLAVLLSTGDTLVFDADHDHTLSTGDTILAKITKGQAMLFFKDGVGPTAGSLDQNELTGAAVSDGFKGSFFTDINGSVVTALDATGAVTGTGATLTVQQASIASLHVTGQIHGHVLAGLDISDVNVGGKLFNTGTQFSVSGAIASGTKADALADASFNNGANNLTTSYVPPAGGRGGNIVNVTIPFGASVIAAGAGADIADGKAGAGGSVKNVTSTGATGPLSIFAGNGGHATTSGTGGPAGSIVNATISEHPLVASDISFIAGTGGNSAKGKGGAAGGISKLTTELLDSANTLTIRAGNGGSADGGATDKGAGGAGGALAHVHLTTQGMTGNILIDAGDAGSSLSAAGKNGGSAKDVQLTTLGLVDYVSISSGEGGSVYGKGNGGKSGAVSDVSLTNQGGMSTFGIFSKAGGDVIEAPLKMLAGKGTGGTGGAVSKIVINSFANIQAASTINSGGGGDVFPGATGLGNGGSSSNVSGVIIHDFFAGGATGSLSIYAGAGKNGGGVGARGGNGGSVKDITLDGASSKFSIGATAPFSGGGGGGTGSKAVGGNGGSVMNVHGTAGILNILAGDGGTAMDGKGGTGGSVSKIAVDASGAGHLIHLIEAGNGGGGSDHHAGAGGSITGVKTTGDIGDFTQAFGISGSPATQGGLVAGRGGDAPAFGGLNGSITDVTAARIATIIAGAPSPNGITAANAVTKLKKITATVIGADTGIVGDHSEAGGNGGTFHWNEGNANSTFELGVGDTAIDGLVIVKGSVAPPLSVTPLKLILVP